MEVQRSRVHGVERGEMESCSSVARQGAESESLRGSKVRLAGDSKYCGQACKILVGTKNFHKTKFSYLLKKSLTSSINTSRSKNVQKNFSGQAV